MRIKGIESSYSSELCLPSVKEEDLLSAKLPGFLSVEDPSSNSLVILLVDGGLDGDLECTALFPVRDGGELNGTPSNFVIRNDSELKTDSLMLGMADGNKIVPWLVLSVSFTHVSCRNLTRHRWLD